MKTMTRQALTFDRAITTLRLLRERRTVYEIAACQGVNVKTVRRSIEQLQALGFRLRSQVDNDRGRKVHWVVGAAATVARMLTANSGEARCQKK